MLAGNGAYVAALDIAGPIPTVTQYQLASLDDPTRENLEAALGAHDVLPVGRLQPKDVADRALFLVAPSSRHIILGAALNLAVGTNSRYTAE